ncbi:uncharacterized protein [Paramormyrops kingsleyae]|uniref:uncharacterized protein n=1 Tax=Paramormyrops kingsleyae TaxID=1676925 RepID=UPI003B974AD2
MEPPPQSDGLLSQDLSTCSLSSALNLTRKGEDSLLKSTSMEALRVVKKPTWHNIGSGNSRGLVYSENESDHMSQPSQQIQPNNTFSNATVTLSYVSRSHVFSPPNSLSQLPPVCGVPSINRKFSGHSPPHEADALANEAGRRGLCVDIDQCILPHAAKPVMLSSQSEVFETSTQAQLIESVGGARFMQQALEINGNKDAHTMGMEKLEPALGDGSSECVHSEAKDGCVLNGIGNSFSSHGSCKEKSTESCITDIVAEIKKCDSEMVSLISRTKEPVDLLDSTLSRNTCNRNGEYVSPLEDPLSPPATSLDETEDVFVLPQTLSSPTSENFTDNGSVIAVEEGSGDLSETEFPVATVEDGSPLQRSFSNSDDVEMPITSNGIQILPADVPEHCRPLSDPDGDLLKNKGRLCEVQENNTLVPDDAILNGSVLAQERTTQRKKLPPRSRRGTRLEAIVQNITPSRYKVTTNLHSSKKCCSSQTHPVNVEVLQSQDSLKDASGLEQEPNLKTTVLPNINTDNTDTDKSKTSTSDSENLSTFKALYSTTYQEPVNHEDTEKDQGNRSRPKRSTRARGKMTMPKICPSSAKQHKVSVANKPIPTTRKAHITKRKRKKYKTGQSSLFSPQEPEIKLKYVNYKDEKRDVKADNFSPFIRMEVKEYSTCTVINYAEEENARLRKGQQQVSSRFISGMVPTTSCLQLGRVSAESKWQNSLVCCLCGGSANTLDLGDLHGPYYSEGHKPTPKPLVSQQDLKEEDDSSDSDSSSSIRRRKHAQGGRNWPQRPSHRLRRHDVLETCRRWANDNNGLQSPSAKRPRTELAAGGWYSPLVVPLDTREYWVHEDCSVWSAGVYLVKGKLYGLEEAVRLAQETVCSTCHNRGATLGCVFKGCSNKYHYACALHSDCVLNEENFSMKCTKHKNKSFKGSCKQESR